METAPEPGAELTLLLFTESFPYAIAHEQTFLEPQLDDLRRAFGRVILIPSRTGGERVSLHPGIEVDESLARVNESAGRARRLWATLQSRISWDEVRARRGAVLSGRASIQRLIGTAFRAEFVRRWFESFIRNSELSPRSCLAYTFWFDHAAVGLTVAKRQFPDLRVVSRINGADIIEERHTPPYLPFRAMALRGLDRVYAVSEFGRGYLLEHYPWFGSRCEVSRLGVQDPGFRTGPRQPGTFVIVSCSAVVPVKRVPLIAEGIAAVAKRRPNMEVEWHHFGVGEELSIVEQRVRVEMPSNVAVSLHGQRSTSEILGFYRDTGIGVFVNASASEGGSPLAIQEAASCSIPIVATDVGGNGEIVSNANGVLVGPNPTPSELADALLRVLDDPDSRSELGSESRRVWEQRFRADRNYADFARRLQVVRQSA